MPGSTLADIKTKVRKLTYSPSLNELTEADLLQYINTFYVFDFPRQLRTLDKRVNINVLLNANQQTYNMSDFLTGFAYPNISELKNYVTSIYNPIYVNGMQVQYTQSQTEFYNYYPKFNARDQVTIGTGAPVIVNWTLGGPGMPTAPVLKGSINPSTVDINGDAIRRRDVPNPLNDYTGTFVDQNGNAVPGTINYFTGVIAGLDMGTPANGSPVYVFYLPYKPAQPSLMLWFQNKLSFWPIPDQGYLCTFEADVTFADITVNAEDPEIREWWQYIAYGAAKKVFEDRMDQSSVEMLRPEMEKQELLINRKFITQQSTNRVATIYSNMDGLGPFINGNSTGTF